MQVEMDKNKQPQMMAMVAFIGLIIGILIAQLTAPRVM